MNSKNNNFEKWNIGDSAELKHLIKEKDLDDFAKLTNDNNPLHMDESYAANTHFGERVVHGMLSASFISTIIGTKLPGKGSLWLSQTLNFLTPARIGDEINVIALVKSKSESLKILCLDIEIKNQYGTKLITGEAKVKVVEHYIDEMDE